VIGGRDVDEDDPGEPGQLGAVLDELLQLAIVLDYRVAVSESQDGPSPAVLEG